MGTVAEKLEYLTETKQLIADAVNAKGGDITPATPFREYADQINGLSGGTEKETLYGFTLGNFLPVPDSSGHVSGVVPFEGEVLDFSEIKSVASSVFNSAFANKPVMFTNVKKLDLSNLVSVGSSGFSEAFKNSLGRTGTPVVVDLSNLESVKAGAFNNCFGYCNVQIIGLDKLTTLDPSTCFSDWLTGSSGTKEVYLTGLTEVPSNGLNSFLYACKTIEYVDVGNVVKAGTSSFHWFLGGAGTDTSYNGIRGVNLGKLEVVEGSTCFVNFFGTSGRTDPVWEDFVFPSLRKITGTNNFEQFRVSASNYIKRYFFPALTEIGDVKAFVNLETTKAFSVNVQEIHFRADMQSVIEGLVGYGNKWGATNAQIIFDL